VTITSTRRRVLYLSLFLALAVAVLWLFGRCRPPGLPPAQIRLEARRLAERHREAARKLEALKPAFSPEEYRRNIEPAVRLHQQEAERLESD
jgi:hypothetical protein